MRRLIGRFVAGSVFGAEHKGRCRAVLWAFGGFLLSRGVESLLEVRKAHVDEYRATLADQAPATRDVKAAILKSFFDWLHNREMILIHPAAHIRTPHPKPLYPVPLTRREVDRLLRAPDPDTVLGLRDRAMLETLYATGMRLGELLKLKMRDVDLAQRLCYIEKGKGGVCRWALLSQDAAAYIRAYLDLARPKLGRGKATPWLFLSSQRKPLCKAQMDSNCRRYAKQAGIKRRVWPHLLRHTAACHLLQNGATLFHVQLFLGHARTESTHGYTRVTMNHLHATIERCHPRN